MRRPVLGLAVLAAGAVVATCLTPAADAATHRTPPATLDHLIRAQQAGTQAPSPAAARSSRATAAGEGGGGEEDGRDGLSEGVQASIAFGAMRSAPAQTVSGGALAAAARQAAALRTVGPGWSEITNKPYDSDAKDYRDPVWSNSGGGSGLVAGRMSSVVVDGRYVYAGSAGGGVWRSTDGGAHWTAVFQRESTTSIGAVAINPADHSLWVGTGEPIYGDAWAGTGIYRSTDHGAHFTRIGGSELYAKQVHRLAFDGNGNVLAATMDGLYRHSSKTTAGSWRTALRPPTNPTSGDFRRRLSQISDVVVRPGTKGRTVVAPLGLIYGSPNDGFYVSTKGGAPGTFTKVKLTGDINGADIGRTTFAYDSKGKSLYAVVQSPEKTFNPAPGHSSALGGVFVSANGNPGGPWKRIADEAKLAASGSALDYPSDYEPGVQADYNQFVQVDPANAKHVYLGLEEVYETTDGGSSWKTIGPYWNFPFTCWENNPDSCPKTTHSDQHAVTIAGGYVWVGNDGGMYKRALHKAEGWVDLNATLRTLQYYKADSARGAGGLSFWGGLQDNGTSLLKPNAKTMVSPFGGDGGDVIVDPENADRAVNEYVYMWMALTTNGGRSDGTTPAYRDISPSCIAGNLPDGVCDEAPLFIAPLARDVDDPTHWVAGGNQVWDDTAAWDTVCTAARCDWKSVHDLGDSALGVAHSTSALAVKGSTIYAGWCGGCNLTTAFESGIDTNYGGTWHRVTAPNLPNRFVTGLTVDPSNAAHVYAVYGGYYTNWIPSGGTGHVFESYNGGGTWKDITGNLPDVPGDALAVTPDDRLALATDLGVYIADAPAKGKVANWARLGTGLPNAPVVRSGPVLPQDDPVDVDLLVVGAGPVGLATALEGTLAGLRVAVVERRLAPVDKACGEGLMPSARASLERLGVAVEGRPFRGIRYLAPGHRATALFRRGDGLGVRRLALSTALGARADELGVKRLDAPAGTLRVIPDGVELAGVTASWLAVADGLHSPLRRALGLARDTAPRAQARYGLRRHYSLEPWSDLVEVYWSPRAEAYVTPVAPDVVGVAVLGPGDGTAFESRLSEFPELRARLEGAPPASALRGAGPLRQRTTRRVAGRALLVGDAAGYVDALTGEGISVGLACARELVRCVTEGRPQDYERAWRRTTRRYRLLTGGLLWAAQRPPMRRTIVPAAERMPAVFARIVDQLGRG